MAIKCKYCGTELPRDDVRFCNNCGMLVPSHPLSPESIATSKSNSASSLSPSPGKQEESVQPALREQVASLPPARPIRQSAPVTLPVWPDTPELDQDKQKKNVHADDKHVEEISVSQNRKQQEKPPETPRPETLSEKTAVPDEPASSPKVFAPGQRRPLPNVSRMREPIARDRATKPATDAPKQQSAAWPTPITHVSVKETSTSEKGASASPEHNPKPVSPPRQPVRELHVKVWNPEEKAVQGNEQEQTVEDESDVEDLPTHELAAAPTKQSKKEQQGVEMLPTSPLALSTLEQSEAQQAEDMPTGPISLPSPEQWNRAAVSVPPTIANNSSRGIDYQSRPSLSKPVQEEPAAYERSANTVQDAASQDTYIDQRQSESVRQASMSASVQENPNTASAPQNGENGHLASVQRRSRRRFPFIIAVILLAVLVLGGIGFWVVTYQPFSVAPITQPQLGFSDTNLGIALAYPNGWTKQVELNKSTAHFYASNHTAQVDIIVAGSSDVNQALQQQAIKLGMGGAKAGATLTFAGQTWQQLQGNLQQSGANYTGTILATVHGNHLFTLVEMAPQSNYAEWESQFFSPMHKTLRLL